MVKLHKQGKRMDGVRCFYILRNFQRPLLQCSAQGEDEMRTEKTTGTLTQTTMKINFLWDIDPAFLRNPMPPSPVWHSTCSASKTGQYVPRSVGKFLSYYNLSCESMVKKFKVQCKLRDTGTDRKQNIKMRQKKMRCNNVGWSRFNWLVKENAIMKIRVP